MSTHVTSTVLFRHRVRLSGCMLLLAAGHAVAQYPVTVNPVVTPPFSPYLYAYQDQMLVNLSNTTDQVLSLKLVGFIEGDNGYSARTNPSYQPPQPIVLAAFATRLLYASSPSLDFLDPTNVTINAPQSVQDAVVMTGQLPEGNYTLCVRALDFTTGEPLSDEAPSGCLFFTITDVQPPLITWPFCGDSISTPWPTFTWSPPIGMLAGADIRYDLYLIELLPGQNAVEAMAQAIDYHANSPIVRSDLMVPTYTWQPYDPILEPDVWYAVAVVARDLNNMVVIQNQGRSEVCLFMLKEQATTTVTQSAQQAVPSTPVLDMLPIPNARLRGRLLYTFKHDAQTATMPGDVGYSVAGPDAAPLYMPGGASDPMGMPANLPGGAMMDNAWLNATDFYSSAPVFPGLPAFPTEKWLDPHPVPTAGARPLKNMPVRLVERVVLENVTVTQHGNVLAEQDVVVLGVNEPQAMAGSALKEEIAHRGRVLATFTTGSDGEFTLDYHQMNPTAFQAAQVTVAEPYIHHFNENYQPVMEDIPTVQAGLAYRVLMLEIASPYYCSPDLRILAQPGDDLQLPDLAVYARSYSLRTKVVSTNTANQTLQGQPLPNMQVKVTRTAGNRPFGIPTDEGQDLDGTFDLPDLGTADLVAEGLTNAQGEVVLGDLVRHAWITPDEYFVVARTDPASGSLVYGTQVRGWWYGDATGPVEIGAWDPDAGAYVIPSLVNSLFQVKEYLLEIVTAPLEPRVIGRVIASVTEVVPGAKVELTLHYQVPGNGSSSNWFLGDDFDGICAWCPQEGLQPEEKRVAWTDDKGFFHFDDIPVLVENGVFKGPDATLRVTKPGFAPAVRPELGKQQLLFGFQWDHTGGILLTSLGKITGHVADESGRPVKSDVKGGDGPTERTETLFIPSGGGEGPGRAADVAVVEHFRAPCPSGTAVPILVEPLSDKYFPATFTKAITAQPGQEQSVGVLVVKEKLHRLRVKVLDPGGSPIAGAVVKLDERTDHTTASGEAHFRFASKDNEFRLKVTAAGSLVPVDKLIVNDVSPEYTDLVITLEAGAKLAGRVVEKGTTAFVPHARVWVELGSDAYGPIRLETIADEIGEYVLDGVPLQPVVVHAARHEEGVTWIGDTRGVSPMPPPANEMHGLWSFPYTKLELQRIAGIDISMLLGFMVELEDYQPHTDGTATIGGAFFRLPDNDNFAAAHPDLRVPFTGVKVKPGAPNALGVPRAVPVDGAVVTDATHVALKLHGGHDMTLEGVPSLFGLGRVTVVPDDAGGAMRGLVNTELSTFKFTYDFNGRFFLGEGPDQPVITTFRSTAALPERTYNVMDMGYGDGGGSGWVIAIPQPRDIAFNLRGFKAHALRTLSYVTTDTFSLRTMLRITDIPGMVPNELDFDVGDVKVMNEDIIGLQGGGTQLAFGIGQWQVKATAPWSFDKDLGCITVPQAKLITHRAQADVTGLLLWPNNIDLDAESLGEVRLGGVLPLEKSGSSPWEFGYSQAEQAWVLGKAAASSVMYFTGVPKLLPDRVDLTVFRLLSTGQDKVSVLESDHRYEDIMDFRVNGLDPGTDNVQLLGRPSLDMPNFPNASARILVSREGGQLKSGLAPITATVPTRGKVEFTFLGGQVVSPGKFVTNGRFLVWDENKQKHFPLIGLLTHTKAGTRIDVIKTDGGEAPGSIVQQVALAGGKHMLVRDGQQQVGGNQWDELWFDANLAGFKALDPAQDPMRFVAKGAVRLSEGAIKMDQIATPFGDMEVTYDFDKSALLGSLSIHQFPSAPLMVHEATLGLLADGGGFMVYCGDADVTVDILPPLINHLQPGFIIGAHTAVPDEVISKVMAKARNKSLPPQLAANRVNGLFITAKKPVLELDLPGIDLEVVTADGHLKTGIDTRYWMDLEQGLHVGGLAYFDFYYGADVTLCEMCLSMLMEMELSAAVQPGPVFSATGCGVAGISGSICGVGVSESIHVRAELSSSGGLHVGTGSGSSCSYQDIPSCD